MDFEQRFNAAKLSVVNRSAQKAAVIESLERDMELLCVTGVEDKLQENVRNTLEQLRNAGLKVWMVSILSFSYGYFCKPSSIFSTNFFS